MVQYGRKDRPILSVLHIASIFKISLPELSCEELESGAETKTMLERLETGANQKVKMAYQLRKATTGMEKRKPDFFDPKQTRRSFFG